MYRYKQMCPHLDLLNNINFRFLSIFCFQSSIQQYIVRRTLPSPAKWKSASVVKMSKRRDIFRQPMRSWYENLCYIYKFWQWHCKDNYFIWKYL